VEELGQPGARVGTYGSSSSEPVSRKSE